MLYTIPIFDSCIFTSLSHAVLRRIFDNGVVPSAVPGVQAPWFKDCRRNACT